MIETICKINSKGFLILTLSNDGRYSINLEQHHITLQYDDDGVICSDKKTLKVPRFLLELSNLKDKVKVIISKEKIDIHDVV